MTDKTNFSKYKYGWELTNSGKFFWDKEVPVLVYTKTDSDHPDKEIFKEQLETLKIISDAWDELAPVIEQEIISYEGKTKEELMEVITARLITLDMDFDTNKPEANNKWSFVIEVEDFGWHVEFEGETHVDTWAGG